MSRRKLRPATGVFSLRKESNDNGIILLNGVTSAGMTLGSTNFQHKEMRELN
jgi:hypothetical protein